MLHVQHWMQPTRSTTTAMSDSEAKAAKLDSRSGFYLHSCFAKKAIMAHTYKLSRPLGMCVGLGIAGRHKTMFPGGVLDCTGTELCNLAVITCWDLVLLQLGLVVPCFQQAVCPNSEEVKWQHPCVYVRILQEPFDKSFCMELLLHACCECILQPGRIRRLQLRTDASIPDSPASNNISPEETIAVDNIETANQR